MDINTAFANLKGDLDSIDSIANNMYSTYFVKYFAKMRELYARISAEGIENAGSLISDAELEAAMSDLPLELFSVSEQLSSFKLHQEVVKLRIKELDAAAKANKCSDPEVDYDKLIQSIYSTVISRVESEISFSREFIMVLKKFWDARRATYDSCPVSEVPDLPDYVPNKRAKTYIQ